MIRTAAFCIAFLFVAGSSQGQQQATYAQYMFNGLAINPAYAGSHQALSVSFLQRFQNVGMPGAPTTQSLSIHTPLNNERVALGLLLVHDKISVINQTGINGIYAYRLPLKKHATLSFGLQAGISTYSAKYSQLTTYQPDLVFLQDVYQTRPNMGFGVYYSNDKGYAGVSMPHLMNNIFDHGSNFETVHQSMPIIVTGGYVFKLNWLLKLKPNFLFKVVDQRIVEFDVNANLLIDEVLWIGASYQMSKAVNWLVEFQVTEQFRLGYSYTTSFGPIAQAELGSHEILVNYRFKKFSKGVVTPRYF